MSDETFAKNYLHDLASLLPKLDTRRLGEAIATMRKVRDEGKTIYICGNGGSASIASQMVVDIVKGASFKKKARFKMIGLTDSMATVSAYANDEGYEVVFAEQLKNFATAGDMLIAISGSGNSPNVLGPSSTPTASAARLWASPAARAGSFASSSKCRF